MADPREVPCATCPSRDALTAAQDRGPVHVLDAGRYFAEIVNGVPMIFRADTAGAVTGIDQGAGGACGMHGVYVGHSCPKCVTQPKVAT